MERNGKSLYTFSAQNDVVRFFFSLPYINFRAKTKILKSKLPDWAEWTAAESNVPKTGEVA